MGGGETERKEMGSGKWEEEIREGEKWGGNGKGEWKDEK